MLSGLDWIALPFGMLWLRSQRLRGREMALVQHVAANTEELIHVVDGHYGISFGWCSEWVNKMESEGWTEPPERIIDFRAWFIGI